MAGLSFVGTTPSITRIEGEPMLKILKYTSEPMFEVVDGKLVVMASTCAEATSSPSSTSAASISSVTMAKLSSIMMVTTSTMLHFSFSKTAMVSIATLAVLASSVPTADAVGCDDVMEVEIHGPVKSLGATYMETEILWPDYDGSEGSLHFDPAPTWGNDVNASRVFRTTSSGSVYNYRNKVLMGMSQTRVLNDPPFVTPKDEVIFDIPMDVVLPDTDEGLMMLSVLEMQSLLRAGSITSVELTNIALAMLEKYDTEYNMLEVELKDLALRIAGEADALFANGTFISPIQGIPFAVKDTYDVKGYATAYGSWEFMENIVETESPLVTYAVEALAVPLFKSSVPQLTWG
jgi:hypothetical protein